ncbi:hypothetical protein KC19_5G194400 [Ceratodon purpureus]|uniref:Uncharacterized protein n=1 Tax=Ceratodon purpureus TaxID=3225 RepID=A0A8T0I6B9_CERPU|nr:hypothetical protein KC19_5G194400 [Ceratodon purpureus]
MDHKERIHKIQKSPSIYSPKKKNYLSRGECPWNYKRPEVHTIDEKMNEIRKWAMRHRAKSAPAAPTGIMAYFSSPPPQPEPEPISPITEEDAEKSPELAQLKEVQEAGDPNF